jgi:activating signal cointegrator 1
MKALTLTQPWATLVAKGAKKIETRSWNTNYRGPLAIHAAKGFPSWAREICYSRYFLPALFDDYDGKWQWLPTGKVVATGNLVHVYRMDEAIVFPACRSLGWDGREWLLDDKERAFGDYAVGRYMWLLENVVALPEPVPAKGALGIWEWSESI